MQPHLQADMSHDLAAMADGTVVRMPVSQPVLSETHAARIVEIEGAQSPDRQGADSLTIPQLLDRFHVPGVSVAVIDDFEVGWTKSWGVADVESCLLYTSPSPRDGLLSRMPSSA